MRHKLPEPTDILLIPSAIMVPDELRLDVGSIPTGMIPLRGKPILERIAEEYSNYDVSNVVLVNEGAEAIRQYASQSKYQWHTVDVSTTDSLGATILNGLEAFDQSNISDRGLYINFADTLVKPVEKINRKEYISFKETDRTYRWTTFRSKGGDINEITPKYKGYNDGPQKTFVGQFGFTDTREFLQYLNKMNEMEERNLPLFYAALNYYLQANKYDLYSPETWLDVGHLDTYHHAKKDFLNAREFNELQVNTKNVITKRSEDAKTLTNEIEWYQQMPTDLQPYLPRLYDWSTDPPEVFLSMEYIGYPSLADIQLYGSHGRHIWNNIFHRLFDVLTEFRNYTVHANSDAIEKALETIYLTKTRNRIERLKNDSQFRNFFDGDSIRVNGAQVPSLNVVTKKLEEIVSKGGLLKQHDFSVIHGDLCLPNILYDPRNGILKLIDPRGEFGEFTIYGDPRYDLAKLRHSFVGHYEHLINDHFTAMKKSDGEILYEIKTTDPQDQRAVRYDSILEERSEVSLQEVKIIEALLYLSMVPLHSDSFERQLCMLGQGLEKISPFVDEQFFLVQDSY